MSQPITNPWNDRVASLLIDRVYANREIPFSTYWHGVIKWLYPQADAQAIWVWLDNAPPSYSKPSVDDWYGRGEVMDILDAIADRNSVMDAPGIVPSALQHFLGPTFDAVPFACLLFLLLTRRDMRTSAMCSLLDSLINHYLDVLVLGRDIEQSDPRSDFSCWLGRDGRDQIHDLLEVCVKHHDEVRRQTTPTGKPSRRAVNTFFRLLDQLATDTQANGDPPQDASQTCYLVVGRVLPSSTLRCRHPGVATLTGRTSDVVAKDERRDLERLLQTYVEGPIV